MILGFKFKIFYSSFKTFATDMVLLVLEVKH